MTLYHEQGPFPPSTQLGRLEFAWETVRDTYRTSGDAVLLDAVKRASHDELTKRRLMTFVSHVLLFLSLLIFFDSQTMYGRSHLFSSIIGKARVKVTSFFSLRSSEFNKTKEIVEWLLIKSRFMYGGISVEVLLFFFYFFYPLLTYNIYRGRSIIDKNHLDLF